MVKSNCSCVKLRNLSVKMSVAEINKLVSPVKSIMKSERVKEQSRIKKQRARSKTDLAREARKQRLKKALHIKLIEARRSKQRNSGILRKIAKLIDI
jgi:hypothetical protein